MDKQKLQQRADALEAELKKLRAEIDKPVERKGRILCESELNVCDEYWFLSQNGRAIRDHKGNLSLDASRINQGRTFHDKESARRFSDYEKLRQRMRKAARASGYIDWNNKDQPKYCMFYDFSLELFLFSRIYESKDIGQIHFATKESAKLFLNSLTDYEKELLREGE